jgi:hypothetical protein
MAFKEFMLKRKLLRRLLDLIGIHFPEGEDDIVHFSGRFSYTVIGGVVLFFVFIMAFMQVSTKPFFCGTCHIMKPYYKAWNESKHNFVPCVDCHFPPDLRGTMKVKFQSSTQFVKYVTRTWGPKPYAEVEDASCLRNGCHETRLLKGKVKFKKDIIFDHKPHLEDIRRGRKLRCTSCHSQIMVGSHIAVTENVCFICHFKPQDDGSPSPIKKCTICHEVPKQDIKLAGITFNHAEYAGRGVECEKCHLDTVSGKGGVQRQICVSCHNQPERIAKYDDHKLIHDHHVTIRKVPCFRCHDEIKHEVRQRTSFVKEDCALCHSSNHSAQEMLYTGTGGRGVEPMPAPMYIGRVDCTGCHTHPMEDKAKAFFSGRTFEAGETSCLECHGEDFKGILPDWKKSSATLLGKVKTELDKTRASAAKSGSADAKKSFDDAEYNYNLVYYGMGVHNITYAEALLNKALENLKGIVLIKSAK